MPETNIKKVATQVPTPVTPTTPQSPISGGTYTVGGNKATSAAANTNYSGSYDPGKSLAAANAAAQSSLNDAIFEIGSRIMGVKQMGGPYVTEDGQSFSRQSFSQGYGTTPISTDGAGTEALDPNTIALQVYDGQLASYKSALEALYDAQAKYIANQAAKLKEQYRASRNDIYTNSRLSAIGNNERLAALGLAGNLYDYARSGTSETSRIAQDVGMRKSLAQQNAAEISANNDLDLELFKARKETDAKYAEYAAKIAESKLPYLMALANAANTGGGSGGGGGGGGYYRSAKKSSKKSGRKSGNSGGEWDVLSIYNAARDASSGNYSNAYKLLESSKNDFRSAGASDRTINSAAALLHDQASGVKRTEQLRGQVIKSSGSKSSSKSSGKRMSGQQR